MNPGRKVIQSIVLELAWTNRELSNLSGGSDRCKDLEKRRLELLDEIYLMEHLECEVTRKQDAIYH